MSRNKWILKENPAVEAGCSSALILTGGKKIYICVLQPHWSGDKRGDGVRMGALVEENPWNLACSDAISCFSTLLSAQKLSIKSDVSAADKWRWSLWRSKSSSREIPDEATVCVGRTEKLQEKMFVWCQHLGAQRETESAAANHTQQVSSLKRSSAEWWLSFYFFSSFFNHGLITRSVECKNKALSKRGCQQNSSL